MSGVAGRWLADAGEKLMEGGCEAEVIEISARHPAETLKSLNAGWEASGAAIRGYQSHYSAPKSTTFTQWHQHQPKLAQH